MADYLQQYTEQEADKLAHKIELIYKQAAKDVKDKMADFQQAKQAKDDAYQQMVDAGQLSQDDYQAWLRGQVFQGKQWQQKLDDVTKVYMEADDKARELLGGTEKNVFAEAANYTAYDIDQNTGAGVAFNIYDKHTVERLLKDKPQTLPKWKIDEPKDYRWNAQRVRNEVAQGIIQGESIDQIGKRLTNKLAASNASKMTMFARTAVTGAQNAGRIDRLHEAQDMGIEVKKKWLATLDSRTRDAHADLDGQEVGVDEKFTVVVDGKTLEIDYPGDPLAPPELVYNCRCTLTYVYPKYNTGTAQRRIQEEDKVDEYQTYKGWKQSKEIRRGRTAGYHPLTGYDYDAKIDVEVTPEVRGIVDGAGRKVTNDFAVLDDYLRVVGYGNVGKKNPAMFTSAIKEGNPGFVLALNRKLWKNPSKIAELVKREAKSGRHIKSSKPEAVITHEYGHAVFNSYAFKLAGYDGYGMITEEQVDAIKSAIMMIEDDIEEIVKMNGGDRLSIRGAENDSELIAEAFSDYYSGEQKPVSRAIVEYFMRRFK